MAEIGRGRQGAGAVGLHVEVDHPRLIRVRGRLDGGTAPMLAAVLRPMTRRTGAVHVDLSALHAFDADGVDVLLAAARAFGRRGQLVLRDPPAAVRDLVARSELDGIIELTTSGRSAAAPRPS